MHKINKQHKLERYKEKYVLNLIMLKTILHSLNIDSKKNKYFKNENHIEILKTYLIHTTN